MRPPRLSALFAAVLMLASAAWAGAQTPASAETLAGAAAGQSFAAASMPSPSGVIRVDLAGQNAGAQSLTIPQGRSAIIELPVDARDVMVTDPKVADAVLRSPRQIVVLGVGPGHTDAAFFDASGRRILGLNIRVDQDFSSIAQTISRLIPGSSVRVEAINNSMVLSGGVASAVDADKAVQIAQQFTAKPEQVLNMLSIAGKDQVMLKVRIVEMQRSVIKQLGFNLSTVLGNVGMPQYLFGLSPTYGVNGNLLGGLSGGYNLNTTSQPVTAGLDPGSGCQNPDTQDTVLQRFVKTACVATGRAGSTNVNQAQSMIQAFEQVGLVRTLAEPNLTAISGESAKFLAGGEFPVPVGEDSTGRITVEFKPFGVGLGFTPVVLSSGRISLKISTEVSELSQQGGFTFNSGSSTTGSGAIALTIPGLTVRRAETTVELPSGGAMMIAGLLSEETKQDLSSVPGLMNLPVLGALFRSRDFQSNETELVVIVTPYLVNPTSPANLQTPADGIQIASDAETLLMGRLNKANKTPPTAVAGRSYQGPVGYVIE
jgi:pilus assembly protein CpaC